MHLVRRRRDAVVEVYGAAADDATDEIQRTRWRTVADRLRAEATEADAWGR